MSEIKHTPGPWGISSQSPRIIKKYDSLGETNVILGSASAYPQSRFFESEESAIKNALLMSAAPELFEALQRVLLEYELVINSAYCQCDRDDAAIAAANAAIAKATGANSC